jgi:Phospholipase D Active site motif
MAWILILLFLPIVGLVFYFSLVGVNVANVSLGKKATTAYWRNQWPNISHRIVRTFLMNTPVLFSFSSKRIKRFHLRGTVWQSIPKDIPNFNHCCVNCKKRSSISTWNITSLKMTLSGVWSGMCW